MPRELNCPHCGCPLLATPDAMRVPDVDTEELLKREIGELRATVARLRGAGFSPPVANPLIAPPARHRPAGP